MVRTKLTLYLESELFILLALMLLLLPFPWVLACVFAAALHELCHALAIVSMGGQIFALRLGAGGIQMETDSLHPGREMVAALAGPLGSALLLLGTRWMPRVAVCGAVHCLYNLLPLFPMDGGRILKNGLALILPARLSDKLFIASQRILRIILALFCLFAIFKWGIIPAAFGLLLLMRQRVKRTV